MTGSRVIQIATFVLVGGWLISSGPRGVPTLDEAGAVGAMEDAVDWRLLAELDVATGEAGDALRPYLGKTVRIPGFVLPLEQEGGRVTEFLLVPYVGACVHTPPPPANQLVHVRMEDGFGRSGGLWEPVWLHGELRVETSTSRYGAASYFVPGDSITPYRSD